MGPVEVKDPERVVDPVTSRDPFIISLPTTDKELESVVEPVTVKLPFAVIGPIVEIEPDKMVEPVTKAVPITVNELESTVEPVTCKVLVPKVATRVFSTEIATDPLATWFIPFGLSPVYLIFIS